MLDIVIRREGRVRFPSASAKPARQRTGLRPTPRLRRPGRRAHALLRGERMLGQEWPLPTFDEMAIASPSGAVSPALDERRSSTPTTPLRFGTDTRRCHNASMSKIRTTVTIDEGALTAVRVRAARAGKGDSEAIERRYGGIWAWTCWSDCGRRTTWPRTRRWRWLSRPSTRPDRARAEIRRRDAGGPGPECARLGGPAPRWHPGRATAGPAGGRL